LKNAIGICKISSSIMKVIVRDIPINNMNINIFYNPITCKLEVKNNDELIKSVEIREKKKAGRPRLHQELESLSPEDYSKAYHKQYYHNNKERYKYKKGPMHTCELCGAQVLRLSRHYNREICRRKQGDLKFSEDI